MSEVSVESEAYRLRGVAEAGPIGKRHTSLELYRLLADCAALAERCRYGREHEQLRGLIAQQPKKGSRRYAERGSDEYSLVCRFVFSNLRSSGAERSNASRYAHALRQAHLLGINSAMLAEHLTQNGGVNALFLARPLAARSVTTKCLHLTRPVTIPKNGVIQLSLRRTAENLFDVVQVCVVGVDAA